MMTTIANAKEESSAEHHVCTFLACPMPCTSQGGCALSTEGTIDGDDAAEGDNRVTFEKKAKFKDNFCDVSLYSYFVAGSARRFSNMRCSCLECIYEMRSYDG